LWKLSKGGAQLQWSGIEKFYGYIEWLRYFITRVFLEGMVLNGEVSFAGEDEVDKGVIQLVNNRIYVTQSWQQQLLKQAFSREQCMNFQPQVSTLEYCEEFEAAFSRTNSSLITCRDEMFQSTLPLIINSLQHYRDHHDLTLGLPLLVHYYISFILDVAVEHHQLGTCLFCKLTYLCVNKFFFDTNGIISFWFHLHSISARSISVHATSVGQFASTVRNHNFRI
jgi:hypothetical protein